MTKMKDEHKKNANTGECKVAGRWQMRKRTALGKDTVIGNGVLAEFCGQCLGKVFKEWHL